MQAYTRKTKKKHWARASSAMKVPVLNSYVYINVRVIPVYINIPRRPQAWALACKWFCARTPIVSCAWIRSYHNDPCA